MSVPPLVHRRFEAQVRRAADARAVLSEDQSFTYLALNQAANRIAHDLQQRGVKPETTVGICLDASPQLACAVWGVLKAGGAYVPLEPSFPPERIRFMLRDAAVSILITEEKRLLALGSECPPHLCLDEDGALLTGQEAENPSSHVAPRNTAYVLYTSGSTGKPKGVVVEHRSLDYYLEWWCHVFRTPGDADVPLTSSFSFAAAISQFFGQLLVGRELHIVSRATVRQPDQLLAWLNTHLKHGLYCVPTLWDGLVTCAEKWVEEGKPVTSPACVYLTGERLPRQLVDRTLAVWPQLPLWNLYGPTEAVANVSAQRLVPGQPVSIGQPIPGTRLRLLDEVLSPVATGATGELYVSGPGLARGYLNRPDLSRATFIPDPLNRDSRLYKSGDLFQSHPDGRLEYVGRADHQVKVRGFRIEVQEIESVLLEHAGVRHAVVMPFPEAGETRLTAFVVCGASPVPSVSELRAFLQRYLPDYMVPAHFLFQVALPVLPNGKVDRAALLRASQDRAPSDPPNESPRTALERALERIWAEVLGIEKLGLQDNFFERGGDSLRAASIITRVRQSLGRDVSYRHVFDAPTLASFAMAVEKSRPLPEEPSQRLLKPVPRAPRDSSERPR